MQRTRRTERQRRWGIGHLLVLLVLVALAPFVLLEVFRDVQDVTRRREAVTQQALGQVEEEAETMEDYLRFTERYLSTLAADPAVRMLDMPRVDALFEVVKELNPNYINVFLLRPDGEQVASTSPIVSDPTITERSYFRNALASGRVEISGVLASRDSGRSAVVFAKRVNGVNGDPVGVLCIVLDLARLSTVIGFVSLPAGSVVLLAQRDGTVIAASVNPEDWVGQSLAQTSFFEGAWAKRSGTGTTPMPDGTNRVVGYQTIQGVPWLMVAGIPQAQVDAVVRESLLRVVQQSTLAALATATLAWIVLRRVVVPIHVLSEGARAFAAGFLNRRVPLRRADELGDLADALNSMAASLERRLEEEAAHAQALRELNQLQAEFVATASHELRTPVTAIRTYAEALMRPDIIDAETRQECLNGIDRASDRLARLARTLLDVSRIDRGQVPVVLAPVAVGAAIRAAVAEVDQRGANGAVTVDVPPDLPPAEADADRLEDVLANLIGNAHKFSPSDAPITVSARARDRTLEITVRDHGPGIPEAERERIFDRFYQVQRGADRRAGGAGLGLYIARAYITAMHGRLWVESAPGAGSVFHIALPTAGAATTAEGEREDADIAGAARGG